MYMDSNIPISSYPLYISNQKVGQIEKIYLYTNKIVTKIRVDKNVKITIHS